MKMLVLGGSRFIGLHLVRLLHSRGHDVTVLNRGRTEADLPEGVARISADRDDAGAQAATLSRRVLRRGLRHFGVHHPAARAGNRGAVRKRGTLRVLQHDLGVRAQRHHSHMGALPSRPRARREPVRP